MLLRAEYVALAEGAKQGLYMKDVLALLQPKLHGTVRGYRRIMLRHNLLLRTRRALAGVDTSM